MKENKSFKDRLSLGWRARKSAVSVSLIIIVYSVFNLGHATLAALSAVFAIRENMTDTYKYAKYRIFGNTIGVLIATTLIFLRRNFPILNNDIYTSVSGGLGVLLVLNFCTLFGNKQSIINSTATFLVVYLGTPEDTWLVYSISRILDTVFGTVVAIAVNRTLPNRKQDS